MLDVLKKSVKLRDCATQLFRLVWQYLLGGLTVLPVQLVVRQGPVRFAGGRSVYAPTMVDSLFRGETKKPCGDLVGFDVSYDRGSIWVLCRLNTALLRYIQETQVIHKQ